MNMLTLYTALSMGFLGSLHCAGMCGPIMLILPFQLLDGWKKVLAISLYHLGRISVYAVMGLFIYSFKSLFHPQWQQYISILLGVLLLIAGICSFMIKGRSLLPAAWTGFIIKQTRRITGNPHTGALLLGGVLNGLLPCGLVYMALSIAAMAASPFTAMLSMYAFGAGTMPMLLAIIILKGRSGISRLHTLRRFVPVMMLVFGGLFLLRGMNLGIPLLSPQITIENQIIKSSCCHH